jgi:acyl-CoA reductase-like NAD-dependent aldehyde dehydrogenase
VFWAARPIEERAKIISRVAQPLLERKSELAKLATLEMGTLEEKAGMLEQLWTMFQSLTGIATDQLALSLQEIPSSNAMEMGQIMQAVGHE